MDDQSVSSALKLFNWANGLESESIFALLGEVGISSEFTSMSADERLIHEAMNAGQLALDWKDRMQRPTVADARSFIRAFHQELDDIAQLTSPPMIGRTDLDHPTPAAGDSLSIRSDNTSYWELQLCTKGQSIYSDDAGQHLIEAGNLVLIPPGVHCTHLRTPSTEVWQHYWCHFDVQGAWHSWCNLVHETEKLTIMRLSSEDTQRIAGLAQVFIDYTYPDQAQWFERAVYCHIEALLIEISAAQPYSAQALDTRIQNALSYIQQNFRENWGVDELAAHCHLSAGRLSVLFKKQLGSSPMSFRDSLRMTEACNLLQSTQKSIGQIGAELGYADQMHFSRRFSDLVGLSPRKYRDSHTTDG